MRSTYFVSCLLLSILLPTCGPALAESIEDWRKINCPIVVSAINENLNAASTHEKAKLVINTICNNITDYVVSSSGRTGGFIEDDFHKYIVETAKNNKSPNLGLIPMHIGTIAGAELCYYSYDSANKYKSAYDSAHHPNAIDTINKRDALKGFLDESRIVTTSNCNAATHSILTNRIAQIEDANRNANALAAKKEATALAKQKKSDDEKEKKESEFKSAMDMGDDTGNVVVWDFVSGMDIFDTGSENYTVGVIYERRQKGTDQLNDFNSLMWSKTELIISKTYNYSDYYSAPVYSEPKLEKDEFETSSAFNERKSKAVELAKREHANESSNYELNVSESEADLKEAENNKESLFVSMFQGYLNILLGENTRTVTYDADKELFSITIRSEGLKDYSVEANVKVPINDAKSVKTELENGKVNVLYLLKDSSLIIQRVVLRTAKKTYLITDVADNIGDFKFTLEAANAYKVTRLAEEKATEERKRKEEENAWHEKLAVRAWVNDQDPVFIPSDAELTYAQRYVQNLKSNMLKASYCHTFISSMEQFANVYGDDPVAMLQINKLFDKAYDAGCVIS